MKKRWFTAAMILLFAAGAALLLYPTVSDAVNRRAQSRVIASYVRSMESLGSSGYDAEKSAADSYNRTLAQSAADYLHADTAQYEALLDAGGNGVMGYIVIPKLNVSLPIYHGVSDEVLQIGAGHLPGSSLPVGGESTHCVISGHRGLPSSKLFTDLDSLADGDRFELHVLGELLTYEVDQILTVEPDDVSALAISEGEDLCTLLTCTPYGVNTQRLLVRGRRVQEVLAEDAAENDTAGYVITGAEVRTVDPKAAAAVSAVIAALFSADIIILRVLIRRRGTTLKNAV